MKARIKIENGQIVQGRDLLGAIIHHLNGEYIVSFLDLSSPNSIEEWRKLYFALRDVLHESVETGYTKAELHDEIKHKIMQDMVNQQTHEWFICNQLPSTSSTKFLTEAGWKEYMKRFREFAMDTFEIYL